jgi:ATP-dependent helicase HrpA
VPDAARAALATLPDTTDSEALPDLFEWLAQLITARSGEPMTPAQVAALPLENHLRMNIRVVDAEDRVVAEGRDVVALKRKLRSASSAVSATGQPARGAGGTPGMRGGANIVSGPSGASGNEHRQWDFGDLPESLEVERNRLRFRAYPAVEDRGTFVARIDARNATEAEATSRVGLTRLAMLVLPQQVKYVVQRVADDRQLVLLSSGLPLSQALPQSIAWRAFRDTFIADDVPIPRAAIAFVARLDTRRAELAEIADRLGRSVRETLQEWRAVRVALDKLRTPAFLASAADIDAQLVTLLPPDFVESTPQPWLERLPRYLKALRRRIERLQGNVGRDAELTARVAPFSQALRTVVAQSSGLRSHPERDQLRWMIEEFRVSLHAQEIRTLMPVSEKRLAAQLDRARAEARG